MLILASASPRRHELLSQAGLPSRSPPPTSTKICCRMKLRRRTFSGLRKRRLRPSGTLTRLRILRRIRCIVLGADTCVVCDGQILGKPADTADARRMLELLSGRTHAVLTGLAAVTRTQDSSGTWRSRRSRSTIRRRGDRAVHRQRRAAGQGWSVCHSGLRGALDSADRRLLLQRRRSADCAHDRSACGGSEQLESAARITILSRRWRSSRPAARCAGPVLDDDGLVRRVSAFADGAHAVERGNAERGGEVAVGAAAGRGLVQIEAELGRETSALS